VVTIRCPYSAGSVAATFDDDTALEPIGDARWRGRIGPAWWVQRGPNGGYVAAIILRGMALAVGDAERHPRSLTVHYLEAPVAGSVELEATVERAGRGLSTTSARLRQGGRTVALAIAAFGKVRPSQVAIADAEPPVLLPEGERPDFGHPEERVPVALNWDAVPAIGGAMGSGARSDTGGLIRLAERRPLDALGVTAAMDGWVPPIFVSHAEPIGVPTVDLTIHFLRPLPHAGTTGDTHYLCRFWTDTAAGGYLVEDGELWAPDGTLLARSRQLAAALG
jgi:acyl-CoA thioesterase